MEDECLDRRLNYIFARSVPHITGSIGELQIFCDYACLHFPELLLLSATAAAAATAAENCNSISPYHYNYSFLPKCSFCAKSKMHSRRRGEASTKESTIVHPTRLFRNFRVSKSIHRRFPNNT